MVILDLYKILSVQLEKTKSLKKALKSDPRLEEVAKMAVEWGQDLENIERWMLSSPYKPQKALAERFSAGAPSFIKKIENHFGKELIGELRLSPSMMRFDGFARYDSGYHNVWFGIDHPDADDQYLEVLLAHELSHVYRDHEPRVWAHLGKPLEKITRDQYLEAMDADEHLASEGLATLNSQLVYPDVPIHVHHYYHPEEMRWCIENFGAIDKAIRKCLKSDQNVWKFYSEEGIAKGDPGRTQYFWAAKVLTDWISKKFPKKDFKKAVIEAHSLPAKEFDCFKV